MKHERIKKLEERLKKLEDKIYVKTEGNISKTDVGVTAQEAMDSMGDALYEDRARAIKIKDK